MVPSWSTSSSSARRASPLRRSFRWGAAIHGPFISHLLRMLGRLVLAGLMTIRYEVIKTGDKPIEVSKVMITEAGRQALEG